MTPPRVELMVVGTPRSGTTLVQRLAVESCELRGAPETNYFSLFPRLLSREASRQVPRTRDHLARALVAYSRSPLLEGTQLPTDDVLALLDGRLVDVYDIFEAVTATLAGGPDRLCEKTPGHLWWWDRIAAARPAMRFVMLVRDPRAVIASLIEARFAHQSLADYVEWWRHDQRLVEVARRQLLSRCLVLRYEDVVSDEQQARRALQTLCHRDGRSPSGKGPSMDGGPSLALPWETWKTGYDGPVTADRVESWRDRLSAHEAAFIVRAASREMRHWGYATGAESEAVVDPPGRQRGRRLVKRGRLVAFRRRQPHLLAQTVDLR